MFKDNKWYNFTLCFIKIVSFITVCSCIGSVILMYVNKGKL